MLAQNFDRAFFAGNDGIQNIIGQACIRITAHHRAVFMQRDQDVGLSLNVKQIVFHGKNLQAVSDNVETLKLGCKR
jgi:hypothetical protein